MFSSFDPILSDLIDQPMVDLESDMSTCSKPWTTLPRRPRLSSRSHPVISAGAPDSEMMPK